MDLELAVKVVVFLGFGTAGFLVLWLLSVKLRRPEIRRIAIRLAAVALIGMVSFVGVEIFNSRLEVPLVEVELLGPVTGQGAVTKETDLPEIVSGRSYRVALNLERSAWQEAREPFLIRARVRQPSGEWCATQERTGAPKAGESLNPMSFEFSSTQDGIHQLVVEMPQGVDKAKISVQEL